LVRASGVSYMWLSASKIGKSRIRDGTVASWLCERRSEVRPSTILAHRRLLAPARGSQGAIPQEPRGVEASRSDVSGPAAER